MFNLESYPEIINHLQKISTLCRKVSSNEYMIFCPYCGDAYRKANPTHGHLYIAIDKPVFNCFRCNTYGTIVKLLLDTGFDNQETLEKLSRVVKSKSYLASTELSQGLFVDSSEYKIKYLQKLEYLDEFKKNNPQVYQLYENYLIKRIGDVDFLFFNLLPYWYKNNIVVHFSNFFDIPVEVRFIQNNKWRYKSLSRNEFYFFQNPKKIKECNSVTICEGSFDCINMFLYHSNDSFYISAKGKNYTGVLDYLNINFNLFLYGGNIQVILDEDNKRAYFYKKLLTRYLNTFKADFELSIFQAVYDDVTSFTIMKEIT